MLSRPHLSNRWPVKDIHDFDGVHGDWLKHAAVTLVVHHHHEEITAGDLLDHKGPANHSTDSQKQKRWGRKEGEWNKGGLRVGLASRQGAWVWCKFPCVSEDLCYECSHSPLAEGRCTEETPLDACQEDDLSHRQLSINIQRHRRTHTNRHTCKVHTHTSLTHSIPMSSSFSSLPSLLPLLYPIQGEHQWSVAEYKTLQRETNGNHTFVLIASHGCVLLAWEIRPCLGLLASDLWPWISFMKKRGRKDDLFFLSPFLSLSLASLPPSLLPQLGDLSSSLWGIYQTRTIGERARVIEWTHTDAEILYTRIHFLNSCEGGKTKRERPDRSKQAYSSIYRNISILTNSILWPI